MAAVVTTMVVGPLLKIVMGKATSYLLDKYKVLKGMEEQHEILMRKLPAILDIITDAEQAAAHREGAAAWLQAIKKVAYQAIEVFDEFKYEALRRKAKREGQYKELGFGVVKLFPTHNRFIFRNRMGRKLRKIVHAIEVLVTEMNIFGFKYQQQPPASSQLRRSGPTITDTDEIMEIIRNSRANDNNTIVNVLVGQANNADLTVVPIVGMGGLGKTTLAQLVYKDSEIQEHFDLLLWVCVSECFDVDSLAKSIVEAAPRKKDDGTEATATSKKTPLASLQNVVSGRRYLLVLDDVWERQVHICDELKACLQHGGRGSVVLTTTRDGGVAERMGTAEAYNLKALEDDFIKEIIETKAFSYFHKEEQRSGKLVNMVDEIVKKCVGSPLAATALGSVLRTKTSEEEWEAIATTSSICTDETGILPILKLSYNDLPSRMKQCFSFCAIFPKDYEIDINKLIQLWIAHGFIQENQAHLETIGKRVFNELASRSFFQDVEQVQAKSRQHSVRIYSRTTCKIHDLMHDVALMVMEKECALATEEPGKIESAVATEEPSQSEWLPNTARHLFLSCKDPGKKLNSSLENSFPAIQTLLCVTNMNSALRHLSKYSSLRALQIHSYRRSFSLKPKHLHHLRYLDLSRSHITTLPEDMSILYNLQTLNLSGCTSLRELPSRMKYMTALRHLYTHDCPKLERMPRDLRKLTSLQTLTCFVAGSCSNCSNVGEIGNLNLGGQLELQQLENVTEKDAKEANLVKKELRELTLKWNNLKETSCGDDARVLEGLEPHNGLHAIRIHSYGGTTCPAWMAMSRNLVEIHLFDCVKLQWLFSDDCYSSVTFPNLKELTLNGLFSLERWWEIDNDGVQEMIIFPQLEKLFISFCVKLTVLPGHATFPNLQNAHIEGCPELKTTAKSPKLSVLKTEGCEAELFLWVARHMASLTDLELTCLEGNGETTSAASEHGLEEVVDAKEKWKHHDFPLAVLELKGFKSGITELCACFVHLQDLSIVKCPELVHWPEKEFQGLVSLRMLHVGECKKLTGSRSWTGYAQASAEILPRLESLTIWSCENLVELFNVPSSLREIDISYCSKLESISGRRRQQGQLVSSIHQGSSSIEALSLYNCDGLTGVLYFPPSLKRLTIVDCDGLTSLESHSPELSSLERLRLEKCKTLKSLLDGPQAYSSLQYLRIIECPCMKRLPTILHQRLGSFQEEYVDAHLYGKPMLLKPKTWKYVCKS